MTPLPSSLFCPTGQFSSLAEFSTQKSLSSPLQPFSVLAPDGGQGMWEVTGAAVWTESWRRGWKTSTAVSACKLPLSKPALMVLSGLEILSLPCAFGQSCLWAAPAEDMWPQPLQVHPPSRDALRALHIITEMVWGQAAHEAMRLCSGTEFIKVQGGSLQRSCARQWEMLCTACLMDLCPLWMHHFKSCCRAQSWWNILCNQKRAGPLRTTQLLMGGLCP